MTRPATAPIRIVLLFGLLCVPGVAQIGNTPATERTVGIETDRIARAFSFQERSQWCWAACISMLLAHEGLEVEQAEIVRRSYGSDLLGNLPNWPGSLPVITANLNYRDHDASGVGYRMAARVAPGAPVPAVLVQQLESGRPVLVGYHTGSSGHAVLITAASYVPTPMGPQILNLVLRDPFPYPDVDRAQLGRRVVPGAHLASRIMAHWYVDVTSEAGLPRRTVEPPSSRPDASIQVHHPSGTVVVAVVTGAGDARLAEVRLHDSRGRFVARQQARLRPRSSGFLLDFANKWTAGEESLTELTVDGRGRATLRFNDGREEIGWIQTAQDEVREWSARVARQNGPGPDLKHIRRTEAANLMARHAELVAGLEEFRMEHRRAAATLEQLVMELRQLSLQKAGWLTKLQQIDVRLVQAQQGVHAAGQTLAAIQQQLAFLPPFSPQAQQLRIQAQQVQMRGHQLQAAIHQLSADRQAVVANLTRIDQLGRQREAMAASVQSLQQQIESAGQQATNLLAHLQADAQRALAGLPGRR